MEHVHVPDIHTSSLLDNVLFRESFSLSASSNLLFVVWRLASKSMASSVHMMDREGDSGPGG